MSGDTFDAGWLALREEADHRARSRSLVHRLRQEGRQRGWSRLVDLGSGTGSNLRYIAARVPWARRWLLLDHDPVLLDEVTAPFEGVEIETVVGTLDAAGLDAVDGADVVTASALLDLVSDAWLERLRDRCAETGAGAYFALSYDGTVRWDDPGADRSLDDLVRDAVNRHQRRDKGMGPALGPDAGDRAAEIFREAGYAVRVEASPWILHGGPDRGLITELVDGWVEAALEVLPEDATRLRGWRDAKLEAVRQGRAGVEVGHVDVLAIPGESGGAAHPVP
ncbi:MAG: class I SAM-dependent methyltransferase [Longimicrobiales bacterium]|nr:class I SAM-dependent methyltransferase [Longimicrobiales bacterium]